MPNIDLLILSLVQGITEFLPISSSAHLILVPQLLCWPDQGLILDVAAHIGTLLAVLVYFWQDLFSMLRGIPQLAQWRKDPRPRLILLLLAASIPALAIGFAIDQALGGPSRDPKIIAYAMIGFGILLWVCDRLGLTVLRIHQMTIKQSVIIGLAQCLAFIPGASRSGMTMSMARLLGYERPEAARFSFLLSIPTIAAAGLYEGYKLVQQGSAEEFHRAAIMTGLSALFGFLAIAFMMYWVRRASFLPFVLYRFIVGFGLLYLLSTMPHFLCS